MDISDKVAIVTGGAGRIGKAMIEILLQKNAKVCSVKLCAYGGWGTGRSGAGGTGGWWGS